MLIMVRFDQEVSYKLVIHGTVSHDLFDNYKHSQIITEQVGDETTTEIEVSVKDQAELCGLLSWLYNLRYIIINLKLLQ